ncbi:hypothetical protein [Paracoccus sp. (in: a-proteobacteria)]|uniref:hypothetical protein n=1 Tax=Paracoccus sp. TaxID=267 RepID=UPI0028A1D6F8|nr:hypothetical protein [Paracoccus sp. (in: a-proteobacteria)]
MITHVTTNAPDLSAARLHEIKDSLVLALDASERGNGYSASEREARSYMRTALRHTIKLMEIAQ